MRPSVRAPDPDSFDRARFEPVRRYGRSVLEFLLPSACAGCGGPVDRLRSEPARICPTCRTRIEELPHPRCERCHAPRGTGLSEERICRECHEWPAVLGIARSAVRLAPPADRIVHALKFGGWPELARAMAPRLMRALLAEEGFRDDRHPGPIILVPVPTTPGRLRRRGYNQAGVLADEVARIAGVEVMPALERKGAGKSQIGLHPDERKANVHSAFSLRAGAAERIRGRVPILIDDVLTTGATASAAALALESGGARTVNLLTYARSLPSPD